MNYNPSSAGNDNNNNNSNKQYYLTFIEQLPCVDTLLRALYTHISSLNSSINLLFIYAETQDSMITSLRAT